MKILGICNLLFLLHLLSNLETSVLMYRFLGHGLANSLSSKLVCNIFFKDCEISGRKANV